MNARLEQTLTLERDQRIQAEEALTAAQEQLRLVAAQGIRPGEVRTQHTQPLCCWWLILSLQNDAKT